VFFGCKQCGTSDRRRSGIEAEDKDYGAEQAEDEDYGARVHGPILTVPPSRI
jgi:hypothetical protein